MVYDEIKTMCLVTSLLICVFLGHAACTDTCGVVPKFLHHMNGNYDNLAQVQAGTSEVNLVNVLFYPTQIPVLNSDYVFIFEEFLENQLLRFDVRVLTEEAPGLVRIEAYNVTNPSYIKSPPELYEVDFSQMTSNDLEYLDGCLAKFVDFGQDYFVGYWDVCMGAVSRYKTILGCNDFNTKAPADAPEAEGLELYKFIRKGSRFPVPGSPASCASICQDMT